MTKLVVTLGPSTNRHEDLAEMKKQNIDFVRANMSHTSLEDLRRFIQLARMAGLDFLLDTEGPQVRTGKLISRSVALREGETIELHANTVVGDEKRIHIRPKQVVSLLHKGDHLHFDGTLLLRVVDTRTKGEGFVTAVVGCAGRVGENKGVAIDSIYTNQHNLPVLSDKDHKCIALGLREKINTIACSFIRNHEDVLAVRRVTGGSMKIFSKVECKSALDNLEEIVRVSDGIIVDRHDLCKEVPKEQIFYTQKQIFNAAKRRNKPVFASSYMLESMVDSERPREHEKYNVIATIHHGADGLVLSAETTVGAHPLKAITALKEIIDQAHREAPTSYVTT